MDEYDVTVIQTHYTATTATVIPLAPLCPSLCPRLCPARGPPCTAVAAVATVATGHEFHIPVGVGKCTDHTMDALVIISRETITHGHDSAFAIELDVKISSQVDDDAGDAWQRATYDNVVD
jgi:hypothetical protein